MSALSGHGRFGYKLVEGWGRLPNGWEFKQVPGVAVDSKDRVYVFNRGSHPMIVFDREGKLIASWGEGIFHNPHGIYISKDDRIYCVDEKDHTARKFTLEGKLLQTIGKENQPGEDGAPFNRPTNVASSSTGEIYASDGYGNSRIHVFKPDGELIRSWGSFGDAPGEFNIPHGVWVHKDKQVLVADRQNNRIQIFDLEGNYLTQWRDLRRPCTIFVDKEDIVYIAELESRVSILSIDGKLLERIGGVKSREPGQFIAPHCAWVDSRGDLYVGEALEGQRIQKFTKNR